MIKIYNYIEHCIALLAVPRGQTERAHHHHGTDSPRLQDRLNALLGPPHLDYRHRASGLCQKRYNSKIL